MKSYRTTLFDYAIQQNYIEKSDVKTYKGLLILSNNFYDKSSFKRIQNIKEGDLERKLK
ncbi:MAG TPA: hypothetical protein VJ895_01275 [Candidatus Nanoarchaeia archaeon]|nr:hypothetical protein [Candidatus Nanoarchaeia archaeon]